MGLFMFKYFHSLNYIFLLVLFVSGISCSTSESHEEDCTSDTEDKIILKVAGYDLDRLKGMITGKAEIDSCIVEFHKIGIGNANSAAFSGLGTYDVTEIGLHPFMLAYANNNFRDYRLIPVFPIRAFRHKSIFIRTDREINKPEDLKGKSIGTPGYSSTSLTWIRGLLYDEYGITPEDINWVLSNKDSSADVAGKISDEEQVFPDNISVTTGSAGKDESELLVSGEIDALFHAAVPVAYIDGNDIVDRLFRDFRTVEQEYYNRTGIFPIMHAVAIKTELIEKYPWLPKAVFEAYSEAKKLHFKELDKTGWAYSSLPWFSQEYENTKLLMGENYWPYGIEPNRKTLETLFRYSHEQGLTKRRLTINDIFEESTIDLTEN